MTPHTRLLAGMILSALLSPVAFAETVTLDSPDNHLRLTLEVAANGSVTHSLTVDGKPVISPSPVGFADAHLVGVKRSSENSVWEPVWGKRAVVPNRYCEATLDLGSYQLQARVYDEGAAFRYVFPSAKKPDGAETSAFNFAGDYTAWYYNGENHNLGPEKLSAATGTRKPVMTIKTADSDYLALHEAELTEGEPLLLESKQGETSFRIVSKPSTSWRVVMFGRTPGALVDSHLIELLNPPPAAGMDFSWVKPGTAVWDWRINGGKGDGFNYGMSLPSWKRMIDFAAEWHSLPRAGRKLVWPGIRP